MKRNQIGKFVVCLFIISNIGETTCYKDNIEFDDIYYTDSMSAEQTTQRRGKNPDTSTYGYVNSDDDKNYESNIIVYDFLNKKINEECFNPDSYLKRTPTTIDEKDDDDEDDGKYHFPGIVNPGDLVGVPGIIPYGNEDNNINPLSDPITNVDFNVVNDDDKETEPYLQTCIMVATFNDGIQYGTGFLAGPNVVVGAAHTVYYKPDTSNENDQEYKEEYFPSKIDVYFVAKLKGLYNTNYEITYKYSAGVNSVSITMNYGKTQTDEEDWCVLELDDNIGETLGYLELEEEFSAKNKDVYTCGYRQINGSSVMIYCEGKIRKTNGNRYALNIAVYQGQSGSPIIYETEDGVKKVCGIITQGNTSPLYDRYGIKFYTFFYRFIDSFMNERR